MFIPGMPVWIQGTPLANIQAYDVARQVPLAAPDPSPISVFSQKFGSVDYYLLT